MQLFLYLAFFIWERVLMEMREILLRLHIESLLVFLSVLSFLPFPPLFEAF